ncbi:sensor histidine kinase [Amycolatopsis minnesotensis]|uniref:Histidine kinase/HSP90-like ATPase domain-containing protein n=1 Tax=Amycolatopsis minnesotensis TaxID=337894 RepID=A0ABP5DAB5_9PSEU
MDAPGAVESTLSGLFVKILGRVRVAVVVVSGLLGVVAAAPGQVPATTAAVGAAISWNVAAAALARRGPRWLTGADLAVTGLLALSQPWTVPADAPHGSTWVCILVSAVVVTLQPSIGPRLGAVVALGLVGADMIGAIATAPGRWAAALPIGGWMLAEAALSAMISWLLWTRSRTVDAVLTRTGAAKEAADVAKARRAAEAEHLSSLHDTACATLMMVATAGPDEVGGLRVQAGRDLERLRDGVAGPATIDLAAKLAEEIADLPLRVDATMPSSLPLPSPAATALLSAALEALRNVARHAGTAIAELAVAEEDGIVVVEVRDRGAGFDPAAVPGHRRGIRHSVRHRMTRAGGAAEVRSAPGEGTTVLLRWPDD